MTVRAEASTRFRAYAPDGPRPEIDRVPPAEWYPLSSGQLALWLVTEAGASHAAYTVPAVYELTGPLDADALRRAAGLLLSRHESLRTAIREIDGVPMQRPVADARLDWRAAVVPDEDELARLVADYVSLDFDLPAGQVMRVLLVERSATSHVLVVSMHHIASDGWSLGILMDELVTAYGAFAEDRQPELAPLAVQYKDYAAWQQRHLEQGDFEDSRRYWSQQLAGQPEPLELPADRHRPAMRTLHGAVASRIIPSASLYALKALCQEERVTLYAGISAVLRVLFVRYTGQRDFILGTSVLGRPVPELHEQVGYYVKTLPLRDTVAADSSIRGVMRAVQATLLEALNHEDYPLDRIVRDAGVVSEPNRNALFDVMVLLEQAWGEPTVAADGLRIRKLMPPVSHSKMDLSLFFEDTPSGLKASVEYATDLYDRDRIDRLLEHFETLVNSAAATPDRPVELLPLLSATETERILGGFNDTETAYDLDTPVHILFEQQVECTPQRIATVDDDRALTFAELNARANALAWTLREDHGVGPGRLVALFLDRSVEMMIAILGVLKAGGAYLPLKLDDPAERVQTVLDDSGATVVLVRGAPAGTPLDGGGRHVLDIADEAAHSRREANPPPSATPADLAYCIYTSGSTGVPKGVLLEHRGLVNRLRWMIDDLRLDASDVILQKTPYSFDVSVWELLLPGMIGATQVMLRPAGQSDPQAIRAAIDRHKVTVLHFVPSMLSQYLAATDGGLRGVRHCVCSGEALDEELARRFFAATRGTPTQLHNYYGPTEATVDVSLLLVEEDVEPITIGRPAANTTLYVLDEADNLCPIGVTGELCIGGVQVARGYLNRPELSAERFPRDPFRSGGRMYRTGDLARWLPHGEIAYLGRRDGQVKMRGFRIELGEIERALLDQDGVERAVVLLQRDDAGNDYLCAYVQGEASTPVNQLRAQLLRRLPDYMAPTHYVRTASIPLTSSGKADRKSLLALGGAQAAAGEYVPPGTEVERKLLDLWTSLLPAGRVGITDDFFTVGGHSLSALQLSSRISSAFGIPMTVGSIFAHRTVADQAQLLAESPAERPAALPTLRLRPRTPRSVLSFAQERMWFLHQMDPDSPAYTIRLLAKLDGSLDAGLLRAAVETLVDRHEMLRVTFDTDGESAFQTVRDDLPLAFEVRDMSAGGVEAARAAARRAVREAEARPFRLREQAPLRVLLLRLSDTEHQLLVLLHHIAGDGWSLRLMMRELSTLYTAGAEGSAAALPQLSVQYCDYAQAVRHSDHGQAIQGDLRYWVDRLADAPVLDLPVDTGLDTASAGGRASGRVSPETSRGLRALADRTGTTPFEVSMAALTLLLSRLCDQDDVVVGFPVANRPAVELERVVGLFLTTLALRTDLSGQPSFAELLQRVATGVHEAYEHQAAPFELVVEHLNPARRLDRTPVFDVLLNYLGNLNEEMSLPDIAVEFDEEGFEPAAKFPLTLYVQDDGEGMRLDLGYRTDLFSAARAETMVRQFEHLLDQVVAGPDAPVASFSLVAPAFGSAGADLTAALESPPQPPVTELIEQRAAEFPDRIAVRQGSTALTYAELVERADAVARQVRVTGHGPGDVVGVTGSRGIGFVVGLLGVLRSGAAAFPVDPGLPAGRRRHLLEIGRAAMFVRAASPEDAGPDPVTAGLPVLDVDAATGAVPEAAPGTSAFLPSVDPQFPAYLFFTSGTTGIPRGVLGWHGALSHFLRWQRDTFGIGPDDRCAQTTSPSFDVSLRDTFLALVSGGTLVIPEPADELGGRAVLRWLERERITVLHAVPTVLQSWLLDAPPGSRLASLRWTFLAGEPLKASLVESLRRTYPDSGEVVNLYGPTETTLAKFAYHVPGGALPPILPVGSPLPQSQAIVARDGVTCGIGEPGEILIRTPFRTRGYLGDPAANEAAFLPNPDRDDEDDLLYRSGDIGRVRPDGMLEVLGRRRDAEVKISGVRIHPAEVENALNRHPLVSDCVVVPRKRDNGEAYLVAYVVAPGADATLAGSLRVHLAEYLHPAAVPGNYVLLESIPTTPNGKPDRAALPEPVPATEITGGSAQTVRTAHEHAVQELWETVLDRSDLGVHDNFFERGGTSLKLLRLSGLLDERFPGAHRVAQLFTFPTIASQAALLQPMPAPTALEAEEHVF